ncbi:MAG: DNA processing protein [Candidatus Berkelbacteria bacterium Licking1014_7]|uniref:DNA processing protein n=1 Tax=Candidatus Berkelbacteria bacterium Licking1014_7 TaxID=2017147 RepID=A0A554LHW6_9BACT|nr:MAG: DNA processing protein [Candidatus Berkelbacteria bacterium Licking1014_7]
MRQKQWSDYPIRQVRISDQNYPYLLKEIPDAPPTLFYKGELRFKKYTALSVVGSRKYTAYGKQAAGDLIGGLAGADLVIVSGLALGIDSISHRAALDANLITWAVIACGLDRVYPASHERLACQILEKGGAIFSEEKSGTDALPFLFPKRNRIIAGLSQATLVVEAAARSGTLITAFLALDYNRSVLAAPHNIFNFSGKGANMLLSLGAVVARSAEDILKELGLETDLAQKKMRENLSAEESKICQALENGEKSSDEICRATQIVIEKLNTLLMMMVIKGIVKRRIDGKFVITG